PFPGCNRPGELLVDRCEGLRRGAGFRGQLGQALLLLWRGYLDQGRRIVGHDQPGFRHIIEEREKRIELAPRDRIEFVIVALGTSGGQSLPYRHRRMDTINDVLDAKFLVDDAGLVVGHVVAVESRRDALAQGGAWQQVAGELLDGEL